MSDDATRVPQLSSIYRDGYTVPDPRNQQIADTSPGDVIAAYKDGTIVLDDGITTWNPERALAYYDARIAELTAENKRIETALTRAALHGIPGQWYCAGCGNSLHKWAMLQPGYRGELPNLCVLCKHGGAD